MTEARNIAGDEVTLPSSWARVDLPWSPLAFESKDGHWRQVWSLPDRWVAQLGGFLLTGEYATAGEAVAAADCANAAMPEPGESWGDGSMASPRPQRRPPKGIRKPADTESDNG